MNGDEVRLRREGYFHPATIRQMWAEHLSGRYNWMAQLWNVLMFRLGWKRRTENEFVEVVHQRKYKAQ